jgi:hypothetical protein
MRIPEELGSFAPPAPELSVDHDDLGRRFLTDVIEPTRSDVVPVGESYDDDEMDPADALDLLFHFGLEPSRRAPRGDVLEFPQGALAQPPVPDDFDDYLIAVDELDLTDDNVHDASLLDHETDELGEVASPRLRTEDTHSHGKPRGGHARRPQRTGGRAR